MKKHLLLVSTLTISLMSAQNNDALNREFERQNKENTAKFDSYVTKHYGANKSPEVLKEIEDQRANLAGFSPDGKPYFLTTEDLRQVYNANVDALTSAGGVSGLAGAYNGEGIKFTIFDGGRVFAAHSAFNNGAGRVTNKEAATENYNAHATNVAGFIGSKSITTSSGGNNGNIQGVAINSTFDAYRFATTTLPGNTSASTVFQKIVAAQPNISNHSYGSNQGWEARTVSGASAWVWTGAFASPNIVYDLQGTYYIDDQNYDQIVYTNPSYIIVKSSGNYYGLGPDYPGTSAYPKYYSNNGNLVQFAATDTPPTTNCVLGFDCIGAGSLAKNIIVVGATDVISTNNFKYAVPTDVVHSDYSGAGPRDDGAIKPDIATTGTNVFSPSTAENTIGSVLYSYGRGTSYSAPVVTGVIGLWTQINKRLFSNQLLNAASAKTLMVHSALEAGNVGPDPWFGWGYIDAKKGAQLLVGKSNNTVIFNDETLTSGIVNSRTVKASGTEPLKVTISWIDPEYKLTSNLYTDLYNIRTSRLVNDLDVRIIDNTTNTSYTPWKLDALNPMTPATKGDNTVDNVEQVVLDNPVAGRTYRIEVTNKGTLVNNAATPLLAPQNYSIIVTGFNEVLGTQDATNPTSGIMVAPTLTKDFVKILKAPSKSIFNVYDFSGKKLQSGKIEGSEASLDLSSYSNGIYIIEVKTDKDIITKKVIKE